MLIPRRTKWRKQHRPGRTGMSKGGNQLAFGSYGIQALEHALQSLNALYIAGVRFR